MEDFNHSTIQFLNNNNIKFMPMILDGKTPQSIKFKCYKRTKKNGDISYVPNYTEFKTITDEMLLQRQNMMEIVDFNTLGIDTYETFQIDIDTDNIDKNILGYMIQNFPYYKSLTKFYGYHFFIRINNFTPPKQRLQFFNIVDDVDVGNVELLCGSWGYFKLGSTIENIDKEIPVFNFNEDDYSIFLDDSFTLKINYTTKADKTPDEKSHEKKSPPKSIVDFQPFPIDEIKDHILNIDAKKYISTHEHHFKICCSLFKYGYDELAYDTIKMIVNPKQKNFTNILNNWKTANNDKLTLATIFYYSKISNLNKFNSLLKKWRGSSIPQKYRKELFQFNLITHRLNQRYLPKDLIVKHLQGQTDKIIHIKSHLGTGKTTIIKEYIKQNPQLKVLYFAPRIAFANDIHSALKSCGFEIYTDIKKKKKEFNYEKVIIQLESLHRVSGEKYDLIVVDEIESVLKQLTSKSTNKRMTETYQVFNDIIKNTPLIVSLDAFLSQHSINIIRDIKNKPTITDVIINEFQPYKRKAYELKDIDSLISQAKSQLDKNEKIVFITLSKTDGDKINTELLKHNSNLKIKYYYGSMSQNDKKFNNVEKEWGDLDVLLYTPIITCGVNFDPDTPYFHSLYIWAIPNSCVVRDVFQASLRVRKLIKDECFFAISRANYSYDFKKYNVDELGFDNIKSSIIKTQDFVKELDIPYGKIFDWGIDNLAFKMNEQLISNHYIIEMMYEYFRICGYELFTYSDKINFFLQDNDAMKVIKKYNDIINIDNCEYKYLSMNPNLLTEDDKWTMLKYEVDNIFDFELFDTNYDKEHFWEFICDNDRRNNLICETSNSINEMYERVINTDEYTFDVFIDPKIPHKIAIEKLLTIFDKEYSYDLNFTQKDIEKHSLNLMLFIEEHRNLFGIRKSRGDDNIRYLTGAVKKIIGDWLKCGYKNKRVRVNNERVYKYNLDIDEYSIKLFNQAIRPSVG